MRDIKKTHKLINKTNSYNLTKLLFCSLKCIENCFRGNKTLLLLLFLLLLLITYYFILYFLQSKYLGFLFALGNEDLIYLFRKKILIQLLFRRYLFRKEIFIYVLHDSSSLTEPIDYTQSACLILTVKFTTLGSNPAFCTPACVHDSPET